MKIKVIRVEKEQYQYFFEDSERSPLIQGITKWDEIEQKDYEKLSNAVMQANSLPKAKFRYFIAQQIDDHHEIFDSAAQFIEYTKEQKKKSEQQAKEYKDKREQAKIARKVKQLEKLKKELEL